MCTSNYMLACLLVFWRVVVKAFQRKKSKINFSWWQRQKKKNKIPHKIPQFYFFSKRLKEGKEEKKHQERIFTKEMFDCVCFFFFSNILEGVVHFSHSTCFLKRKFSRSRFQTFFLFPLKVKNCFHDFLIASITESFS